MNGEQEIALTRHRVEQAIRKAVDRMPRYFGTCIDPRDFVDDALQYALDEAVSTDAVLQAEEVALAEIHSLRLASSVAAAPAWRAMEGHPHNRPVLVFYRNALGKGRTVRAIYADPRTIEVEDIDEADDYDEAEDRGWLSEGWYEAPVNSENYFTLEAEPTHWQPLPPPPALGDTET